MAEEILDGADVGAALEEAGCEGVAQRVTGGEFGDIGLADGVFELALHGGFMEVMTSDPPGVGMGAESGRGKDVLPRVVGLMASATRRWRKCWRAGEIGSPSDGMSDGGVMLGV